jgi:hypothetical protein
MIKKVSRDIVRFLKDGDLIILRSTVKLKTTENIVIPILNKSKKKYYISFCPERTIEGHALKELKYLPQIIGSLDFRSYFLSRNIFNKITKKIIRIKNIVTAEMCPSCKGSGIIGPSILLADDIEKDFQYLLNQGHKNLSLQVNPIVKSYLTKGGIFSSIKWKWFWKYKVNVAIQADINAPLTQYLFIDKRTDDIIKL